MAVVKSKILRIFLFSCGAFSLVLGVIGIFMPILPTTPFVLLSAWCFLKSSPKAHQWIYRQPILGDALRNWEETRSISRRTKLLAVTMILVSVISIWIKVQMLWLKVGVTLLLCFVMVFIVRRSEIPRGK